MISADNLVVRGKMGVSLKDESHITDHHAKTIKSTLIRAYLEASASKLPKFRRRGEEREREDSVKNRNITQLV